MSSLWTKLPLSPLPTYFTCSYTYTTTTITAQTEKVLTKYEYHHHIFYAHLFFSSFLHKTSSHVDQYYSSVFISQASYTHTCTSQVQLQEILAQYEYYVIHAAFEVSNSNIYISTHLFLKHHPCLFTALHNRCIIVLVHFKQQYWEVRFS